MRREEWQSGIREALLSSDSLDADPLVNQYCEQFPDEAFGWVALGEIYLRRSDFVAARNAFLEALACDLNNESAIAGLGHIRSCLADPVARLAACLSNKFKLSSQFEFSAMKFTMHAILLVGIVTLVIFMKKLR